MNIRCNTIQFELVKIRTSLVFFFYKHKSEYIIVSSFSRTSEPAMCRNRSHLRKSMLALTISFLDIQNIAKVTIRLLNEVTVLCPQLNFIWEKFNLVLVWVAMFKFAE